MLAGVCPTTAGITSSEKQVSCKRAGSPSASSPRLSSIRPHSSPTSSFHAFILGHKQNGKGWRTSNCEMYFPSQQRRSNGPVTGQQNDKSEEGCGGRSSRLEEGWTYEQGLCNWRYTAKHSAAHKAGYLTSFSSSAKTDFLTEMLGSQNRPRA